MKRILLYVVLPLLLIGVGYGAYYTLYKMPNTYITVDINPSVEFEVSKMGNVIEVTALNEDAAILLSDLDLIGLSVEEATKIIVESATEMGYINELDIENEIVIVAYSNNDEDCEELELQIRTRLEEYLDEEEIPARVMTRTATEEQKQEAEERNVSLGKVLYISKALYLNENLDEEELYGMSMNEINKKIKEHVDDDDEDDDDEDDLIEKKQEYINNRNEELEDYAEELWEQQYGSDDDEDEDDDDDEQEQNRNEEQEELLEREREEIMNTFQEQYGSDDDEDDNNEDSDDDDDEDDDDDNNTSVTNNNDEDDNDEDNN